MGGKLGLQIGRLQGIPNGDFMLLNFAIVYFYSSSLHSVNICNINKMDIKKNISNTNS